MTASKTALEQVLDLLAQQDELDCDYKIPADLYAQAVQQGLASTFNFYICANPDATGPDDETPALYAVVYPIGMDATWKGPMFIEQLLPEAIDFDECMETEWHFHKAGLTTPAQIAELLTTRGLVFDAKRQNRYYPDVLDDVAAAVATAQARTACPAPKNTPKAPKP